MSQTDCFQALGVASDASWDQVRQAYKDLVRVWHPDRFQSDPQMQERAEQQLQKINEAYFALKNSQSFRGRRPEPDPQPPPPPQTPPKSAIGRSLRKFLFRWPVKVVWWGLVWLTPVVFVSLRVHALRVPNLDAMLQQNNLPRPGLLSPSQFIDPPDDRSATEGALSRWARKASDLWRSIPKIGEKQSARVAAPASDVGVQKDDVAPHEPERHRDTVAVRPAMPVNGTELLWTRRAGAGELWVSNETGHDALATLVQAHTTAPVRAIYIQAKNKVCMRNVAPGLYDLMAEVGENWDPNHIHFRSGRHALDRSGPFECMDVTSTQGTSGCRYEVVLRTR
jgi:hypothetical protein